MNVINSFLPFLSDTHSGTKKGRKKIYQQYINNNMLIKSKQYHNNKMPTILKISMPTIHKHIV